jgi:hypothetical protein
MMPTTLLRQQVHLQRYMSVSMMMQGLQGWQPSTGSTTSVLALTLRDRLFAVYKMDGEEQ